jgi:N-acetylglucosaminyldiphosphoundecaprenol N-acetyl-beta-D-mannosaminyltransferase
MTPNRIEILGVPTDCVTRRQAMDVVEDMLRGAKTEVIAAVNPEKVIKARRDPGLLDHLRRAGLLIPDGIGVVLAARLFRMGRIERVPGCELMQAICERAGRGGEGVFLFGASPEVNARAADVLRWRYAGLRIVGAQHGYLAETGMPALIDRINASGAAVLFVALGSPKQEEWMDRHAPRLAVKICQGVGGTFDVLAGRVRRAPLAFRALGLEWFYRLATQPRRLLRQTALPTFAWGVLWTLVSSGASRGARLGPRPGAPVGLPR